LKHGIVLRKSVLSNFVSAVILPSGTLAEQLTPLGLRLALFFSRTYARLLRPKPAAVMPQAPPIPSTVRSAFDRLETEIHAPCEEEKLAD
jgi:hypothetical protein